ncbi:hypothetical protein F183_A05740 [Bryobacterales bacterium F-183]|nr:hypothetical protein F183_A05740 [Bryobacterales bacterium F-183]
MAVLLTLALPVLLVAAETSAPPDFDKQVKPILASRCEPCHRPGGKLVAMSTIDDARKAGNRIVDAISGDPPRMPKGGKPLAASEVDVIRKWVASEGTWWSLRALPAQIDKSQTIDTFIAAGLAKAGITASPEADRRTLIRRLYVDLHGMPPTLAEVEAFVADKDPQAYEKLVDKLLASPRYGERWARHWLDVAHYGDSHGYDKDKPRNNAWPYRDWVIDAFNSDKPYKRFIQEQIAGDILFPADAKALTATGFLAAGPWDFVGHAELKEGSTEKDNTRLLDRDDIVAQVMSSFTSMTVHCARCHDHKFDPIPQEDYYNLQAVFAGVDRADRPFDEDPAVFAQRRDLMEKRREAQLKLQPWLDKVEFAKSPAIDALTDRIQDGKLLMVHMGTPKTPAEAEEKKRLQDRVTADTAKRKELVDALVGQSTYDAISKYEAEAKAIDEQIAALPKPRFVYAPAAYFPRMGTFRPPLEPRPVHVLNRGSVTAPGKLAHPAALRVVNTVPFPNQGDRRAALAEWLSSDANMLTWRSVVNRVWHYHFGSGIVDSPNDFGRMGGKPSHPELLDWLAVWFRDDAQGSLKKLHRLIVTSKAYRQSSQHRDDAAKIDGDNRLLWRMNRTRLDAESTRDAVLQAAGVLDLTMGGPAVRMFAFKDDHSPVYDYAKFDPATPGAYRRSIYRFTVRSAPDPFMDRLDCPDPSVLTPARTTTLTAVQALVMWNDPFMIRIARELANAAKTPEEAVRRVLLRNPTAEEKTAFAAYTQQHGLENLCRLLLNTNEFLFVD